ncbi:hypothetical protein PYW07_015468 [Mythimna separata]|uniref:Uncharacterized protein n=1 Tax=Mythimna separata TaxID=271217 RepID=A0AAD7YYJ5_MYTSE|nr:hypothetical protein PYW07_015468 [Mythimna separata]
MFFKIVALCGVVAVCQAGLLTAPVQYSSAAAVSSQNIVRHDEPAQRASVAYQAAPAYTYRAAPAAYNTYSAPVAYQAAPAAYAYRAAPAPVAYNAAPVVAQAAEFDIVALCGVVAVCQAGLLSAPVQYSSAAAVSSQNIVRHDEPAQRASVAYQAAPAYTYRAAPAAYNTYSAPVAYQAAPAAYAYRAAPAPVVYKAAPVVAQAAEFDAHPKYEYTYSVADSHTGDNKSQQESRDGDVVKGSYSFHEADGSVRTVEYSADDHSGFNAVVHNTAPTAAPVQYKAAPAYVAAAHY